ncbi:hypothetical protein [Aeromonas caviae]|uniref:Uncharacterized protein n=1 Tax=Aeromonas caviae TaxID=648 RepID=A0AAJ6CS59_AERCA|nr:hypothetical protein [Aeromonas caviae]WFG00208.1 hypothetical protein P5S46_22195 [Aeromonas caviae]
MHLQKPLSLLDELEMELSMRAVSKHRNIPFEVTRYEREGDDTVVYGYNLLTGLSQEIKGTLSLTASDKHGDLHSATLFERHQDGPQTSEAWWSPCFRAVLREERWQLSWQMGIQPL